MADYVKKTSRPVSDSTSRSPTTAPQSTEAPPAFLEFGTPQDVLTMQGIIGNHALQRLLVQREPGPPVPDTPAAGEVVAEAVDNPLTPEQVDKARGFYARRSGLYTPDIISRIQAEVGATVTGTVDEEMIQAVARFQRDEGTLAVDGIAGPRTLPAAFPSGLATEENEAEYVADIEAYQGEWGDLETPEARMEAIMEIVNARLTAAGVPPVDYEFADTGAASAGFSYTEWEIKTGRSRFEGETISDEELTGLAYMIYHEARHAEQHFSIARMLAGKGRTPRQILDETGYPTEVISAAVADPLPPDSMEAIIARGWYDSQFGRDAARRRAILREVLAARREALAARRQRDADPTPANEARWREAQARFNEAYAAYTDLPEEADAHRVHGEVETLLQDELAD